MFDMQTQITISARAAALAWINAFLATSDDETRPILNRTLCLEVFEGTSAGVQFIATNGHALFRTWVPAVVNADDENATPAPWPILAEAPEASIIVMDLDGFGLAFMRRLLLVTGDKERANEELVISTASADDEATIALGSEFMSERVTLRSCGQRIDLRVFEDRYPDWRKVKLGISDAERVDGLTIATRLFALVGKLKEVRAVDMEFFGQKKHVAFTARGLCEVRGLLMPMRREKVEDDA